MQLASLENKTKLIMATKKKYESIIRDIKRQTRRKFSAEEKMAFVWLSKSEHIV